MSEEINNPPSTVSKGSKTQSRPKASSSKAPSTGKSARGTPEGPPGENWTELVVRKEGGVVLHRIRREDILIFSHHVRQLKTASDRRSYMFYPQRRIEKGKHKGKLRVTVVSKELFPNAHLQRGGALLAYQGKHPEEEDSNILFSVIVPGYSAYAV